MIMDDVILIKMATYKIHCILVAFLYFKYMYNCSCDTEYCIKLLGMHASTW